MEFKMCIPRHTQTKWVAYVGSDPTQVPGKRKGEERYEENKRGAGPKSTAEASQKSQSTLQTVQHIKSWLCGNVTGMYGALSVFGRLIEGMIRLRSEQVRTCNVTRHHRPLLSPSGSCNELGTPWCNTHRILLHHEARDEGSDRNSVSCQSLATLRLYGTW
jgi:hypothetical protein